MIARVRFHEHRSLQPWIPDAAQSLHKHSDVEWLLKKSCHPGSKCAFANLNVGGNKDNGDAEPPRLHLKTIEAGHSHVENHALWPEPRPFIEHFDELISRCEYLRIDFFTATSLLIDWRTSALSSTIAMSGLFVIIALSLRAQKSYFFCSVRHVTEH